MPTFNIPCPHCGKQFSETRAEFHVGDELVCPTCGTRFQINQEFVAQVQREIERAVAKTFGKVPSFRFKR